jgi:hypothetical protein
LQVSGVFQSIAPGTGTVASLPVNNATAGLTLGRPIATSGGVINAPLINPAQNKDFADRVNQVDLRLTKGFRVGRYRLDALVDFYNAFNVICTGMESSQWETTGSDHRSARDGNKS